jgi:hypothetical protein
MLTPEQAKAILDQRREQHDDQRRRRALADLPETLRTIAFGLLGCDAEGRPIRVPYQYNPFQRQRQPHDLATEQLDSLPPADRVRLLAAFFPTLADAVEQTWQFMQHLPYGQGGSRGMFRAPSHPDVTRARRGRWLVAMVGQVGPYHTDVAWLARHAGYLGYGGGLLAALFAAVVDSDAAAGDEVFDILVRTARGADEVGTVGAHATGALLAASRPDGWEAVEQLLLAAQREEGLRQVILAGADDAHPEAFRRLVDLIVVHDLARFSAVTALLNQWLGTSWESGPSAARTRTLAALPALLDDASARRRALAGNGEDVYLSLWTMASRDVFAAVEQAAGLVGDPDVRRRFAAVHLLASAQVFAAQEPLLQALADPDPRVAGRACQGLRYAFTQLDPAAPAFERIEVVLSALPPRPARSTSTRHAAPPTPLEPLLWDLSVSAVAREELANLLLSCLGARPPRRLLPYLNEMSAYARAHTAQLLMAAEPHDPAARAVLLGLLGDRTSWVRERALTTLADTTIQPAELPALEALLTRRTADLRRGILQLVLRQPDDHVLESVDRLLAARQEPQRRAGLELLRLLHEAGQAGDACAVRAAAYRARHPNLAEAERVLLRPILDAQREVPMLDNALGLVHLAECTVPPAPTPRLRVWVSPAAVAGILALDALVHEHRADAYTVETRVDRHEVLLGADVGWFPQPDSRVPVAQDVARLPFADLWREWAQARPAALRDADGLEWLRMALLIGHRNAAGVLANLQELGQPDEPRLPMRYARVVQALCGWLARLHPAAGAADFLLDHLENTLATLPEDQLREREPNPANPWEQHYRYHWLDHVVTAVRVFSAAVDAEWTDAHAARLWRLLRWSTTLPREHLRYFPLLREALEAQRAGAATQADLLMQLLGPRPQSPGPTTFVSTASASFSELRELSTRAPHRFFAAYPELAELYRQCVSRVLEVELERGEMPTAATGAALSLRSLVGATWFVRLLQALGTESLARGDFYQAVGKAATLSHVLRVTFPAPEDTPHDLKEQVAAARIPEQQLTEAAVYAPQWARHVEHVLGWAGFAEAVWWVYAHTKDRGWAVDPAIRKEWAAQISEWTPLASADLFEGAVDVAWFRRVYGRLGAARWEAVYQAAKYATSGTGHARARLFADAMLGRVDEQTLAARIATKRNRDAACALGLLALPTGKKAREQTLLARYHVLQEFVRTARGFGAQRREGDQKAARIGLDNLARTAGYPDPQRFQWAMELREVADLRGGAIAVTRGDVTLMLRLDALGQPRLDVTRASRLLKAIPGRLKQDPEVVALRGRVRALEQQLARMRLALEQAMCREEAFPAAELQQLLGHPALAPLLEQLVFVGPAGSMGYLVQGGRALRAWSGEETPVAASDRLRIAHAYDLFRSGAWSQWQRECFVAERIQPFKQVFRELYVLTETERQDGGAVSHRYAGQQIQSRQAMALLGQRGWVTSPEDATATRTFHERGITASVEFLYGGGTPVEVEGLTVEGVCFFAAGDAGWGHRVPLDALAPVVFSEVMRDLDLVVSVAHRGGVDPEATASTVELRAALVREVGMALGLTNVRLQTMHALIQGTLGEYSLHLGSGTVHLLPGGALCIVPVHAQHRGRLFLPFADDDPKTAEIVSKVLLLARDAEIRDPLILQQIYARA